VSVSTPLELGGDRWLWWLQPAGNSRDRFVFLYLLEVYLEI
jgi:hypothetical protein